MKSDFLRKLEEWQKIFPERRSLDWKNGRLENGYCKDCRLCCGPQGDDKPFPMALLDEQLAPDAAKHFYLLEPRVAYLGREGCKSLGKNGCLLPLKKRPPACGLFPIVLIDGRLYLYKRCPAAMLADAEEFAALASHAEKYLKSLGEHSARAISISVDPSELKEKYADLGIEIFSRGEKKESDERGQSS